MLFASPSTCCNVSQVRISSLAVILRNNFIYHALKTGNGILQLKGYAFELVELAISFERSKQPFFRQNRHLVICALWIQAGEPVVLSYTIRNGLHTWQRVSIKQGEFVYSLAVVNAQALLVIAVVDCYNLRFPPRRAWLDYAVTKLRLCHHKASVLSAWQWTLDPTESNFVTWRRQVCSQALNARKAELA